MTCIHMHRAVSVLQPDLNHDYEMTRVSADVMLLELGGYDFLNHFTQRWEFGDKKS